MMQVLAEWFSGLSFLGKAALSFLLLVLVAFPAAVAKEIAEKVMRLAFNSHNENRARLKVAGTFSTSGITRIERLMREEIRIKIENVGAKDVIIHHIELCREKKRGIWFFGRKSELDPCKFVESRKEHEPRVDAFMLWNVAFIGDPSKMESSEVLEAGKSCARFIPLNLSPNVHDLFTQLVATKKEAKTVRFVVCTDYGKFPVKSDKDVKKFVVRSVLPAIKQKEQNLTQ